MKKRTRIDDEIRKRVTLTNGICVLPPEMVDILRDFIGVKMGEAYEDGRRARDKEMYEHGVYCLKKKWTLEKFVDFWGRSIELCDLAEKESGSENEAVESYDDVWLLSYLDSDGTVLPVEVHSTKWGAKRAKERMKDPHLYTCARVQYLDETHNREEWLSKRDVTKIIVEYLKDREEE